MGRCSSKSDYSAVDSTVESSFEFSEDKINFWYSATRIIIRIIVPPTSNTDRAILANFAIEIVVVVLVIEALEIVSLRDRLRFRRRLRR